MLADNPDDDTLEAAGIVASWLGGQGARGTGFTAATELPAQGNAVVVATGKPASDLLAPASALEGPTLAVLPNPNDQLASILVVAGRDSDEAVTAALALTAGSRVTSGSVAYVRAPELPPRRPYDAPAWIPTDRPVQLGELVDAAALQIHSYRGLLEVPFRTAPDFYTWRDRPFRLDVQYRAPRRR